MATFDCMKHTVFQGNVYRPGEQLVVSEADAAEVPKHFVRVDNERAQAAAEEVQHAEDATAMEEYFETLWPVARAHGIKQAELRAALAADGFEAVAEALKDGTLAQENRD
jgi:hypothetical protein